MIVGPIVGAIQAALPRLVLASASPARAMLLAGAGLRFEAKPAHVDEAAVKAAAQADGMTASDAALLLAGMKAARIRDDAALVIGADQILVCEGRWFDKPHDLAEARGHLRALRGRRHTLETAMVCWRGGQEIWRHVARPRLAMRAFSDAFLEAYCAAEGDALLGSVGAYRLEGLGLHLFDAVEGEHDAVLGLPLLPLIGFLRQHGVLMV